MKVLQISKLKKVVPFLSCLLITASLANVAIAAPLDFQVEPSYVLAGNYPDQQTAWQNKFATSSSSAGLNESAANFGNLNFGVLHKYLGYGTLLFVAAAAITGESGSSFHKAMGRSTAGMAALTATAGILEYADDIEIKDGFTFTNIHALLGSVATVGFIANAVGADDGGHGGVPIASGVMAFGGAILIHF